MRLSLLSSSLRQQNNEAVFEPGYHLNALAFSPEQEDLELSRGWHWALDPREV